MSKEEKKPKKHSVTITLDYPMDWLGENITEVKIVRPKGKHLKKLGNNITMEDLMDIASKTTDFTPKFFDALDAIDCLKITGAIGDFLDSGQETSKNQ